ncbi:MAG: Histidine kinase, partial [Bacteroidetes bacterium]|nr:Histidine kinase [Bacteroidota bacterium]
GVSIIDPIGRKFTHYQHLPNDPSSLSNNIVSALSQDVHGNLWVGTYGGGLNVLYRGTDEFTQYHTGSNDPKDDLITSVVARRNGEVWAAFSFSGLMRILPDGRKRIRYKHTPGDTTGLVGINVIRAMYEDSKGRVWIGTHGFGVLRYDQTTNQFTRFSFVPGDSTSMSANHVWSIFEDRGGYVWLGMWRYGLNRFDPRTETFQRFDHVSSDSTSISDHTVLCMAEDLGANLWVGTAGGGLQMFTPSSNRFTRFHEGRGFPDNMVYGTLVDNHNVLWVSTGSGLVRFEPRTRSVRVFDVNDGVQSSEFIQGAFCKGSNGRMYFGGINGFNEFHPDSIVLNPTPPPVVITRFIVFDREIPLPRAITATHEITLERNQNFFSFEFAALDFTAPAKNKYLYRLRGFDRDWINAGSRRLASYTNVGPGTYEFQVKGSNNDGVWNEEGVTIAVTVLPSFWETWWFRVLAAGILAGLAYSFYRYRVNKLLAIQRTRERIARDLHDEVSAILSGISYFSSAVHEDSSNRLSEKSTHFMSLINRSSTEVLELLHDIIWSINPEGDRFDNIAAKLRRYASDLCESRSIRYVISIPETLPTRSVGPEKRKNFWLMYKEMVTNAVRHSGCSELTIRLGFNDDGIVHLQVSDNGRGFDSNGKSGHNGLKNIQARATALNAKLLLETAPGKGTHWDLQCTLMQ